MLNVYLVSYLGFFHVTLEVLMLVTRHRAAEFTCAAKLVSHGNGWTYTLESGAVCTGGEACPLLVKRLCLIIHLL